MTRRRIWCETAPHALVREKATIALLRKYGTELLLAVRPPDLETAKGVLAACAAGGVRAGVWPMIDDEDGRWASAKNAERFALFARRVLDACEGAMPAELVVDLEPPIAEVRTVLAGNAAPFRGWLDAGAFAAGKETLTALTSDVRARGVVASAVVVPLVVFDGWEQILGTPVTGPAWSHVSVMAYSSILEGWSRGFLKRDECRAMVGEACRAARERFGEMAGGSLGVVGQGALGDENVYRAPGELADDVAVARAAGVDDLTLFDLGGVLRRPPAEAWLDAFVETPAKNEVPRLSVRPRTLFALARFVPLLRR
jgi:hypothetical protein